MKLLFCPRCWDVIKLKEKQMRSCECGYVYGRYLTNELAEVSDIAISIAIGNGSLINAIDDMKRHSKSTDGNADREEYYQEGNGKISHAWVRPNSGKGNPHTVVIRGVGNRITVDDAKKIIDNPL